MPVAGKLVDVSGKAIPLVRLLALQQQLDDYPSATTDEHGGWSFSQGFSADPRVTIVVRSPRLRFKGGEETLGSRYAQVEAGSMDNVLVVDSRPMLSGRVVDERGRAIPGAMVWLHTSLDADAEARLSMRHWTESDAEGRFLFGSDPECSAARFLSARTAQACSREPLAVGGDGRVSHKDLIIELVDGSAIEGQVVDDEGVGLPGVRVTTEHIVQDGRDRFHLDELVDGTACSNREGLFRIAGLPPATWKIRPRSHGFVLQGILPTVRLGLGQVQKGLRIVMTRGLSISGRLQSKAGEPLPGISIEARLVGNLSEEEPGVVETIESNQDGSYEILGLRSGVYELSATVSLVDLWGLGVWKSGSDDGASVWYEKTHRKRVAAGSRIDTWKIELPRFGGFQAHLPTSARQLESLEVWFKVANGERLHQLPVKGGVVSLTGLLVGSYDIRFATQDFEDLRMKLEVQSDQVTQLGLLPLVQASAVAGRVVDADGRPLAGAWIGVDPSLADLWNTCDITAGVKQFDGRVLAVSDVQGRFSLPVKIGESIYVFKRGYVTAVHAPAPSSSGKGDKPAGLATKNGHGSRDVMVRLARGAELRVQPLTSSKDLEEEYWKFVLLRVEKSSTGNRRPATDRWRRSMLLDWNRLGRIVGLEPGSYRLYGVNVERIQSLRAKTVLGESYYEEFRLEAGSDRLIQVR